MRGKRRSAVLGEVPSGVRVEELGRVRGRVLNRFHSGGLDAGRSVAECLAQCLALDFLACLCRVDFGVRRGCAKRATRCEAWRSA